MNKCEICGNEFNGLICPRCAHNITIDLENRTLVTKLTKEDEDKYNTKIKIEKEYYENNKQYTYDNIIKQLDELEKKLQENG